MEGLTSKLAMLSCGGPLFLPLPLPLCCSLRGVRQTDGQVDRVLQRRDGEARAGPLAPLARRMHTSWAEKHGGSEKQRELVD